MTTDEKIQARENCAALRDLTTVVRELIAELKEERKRATVQAPANPGTSVSAKR